MTTNQLPSVELSPLELEMLTYFVRQNNCSTKARRSLDAQTFYLILNRNVGSKRRLAIEFPRSEWSRFYGDPVLIGPHPYNGRWFSEYPHSHWPEDNFDLATREDLLAYFIQRESDARALSNRTWDFESHNG